MLSPSEELLYPRSIAYSVSGSMNHSDGEFSVLESEQYVAERRTGARNGGVSMTENASYLRDP